MKNIQDSGDLNGKKVLVRIDIDEKGISQLPVTALIPTLDYLKEAGAKTILLGHVGMDRNLSAEDIFNVLKKEIRLSFIPDIVGDMAKESIDQMSDGEVVLLENVRRDEREITNDEGFSQELASLADVYVNEAFAVSHREHASVVGVPKYLPSFAGFQFQKEVETLSEARKPKSPSIFILGGAKTETKLPLLKKFVEVYDQVFVGGVLANDFFKAKDIEIGISLTSKGDIDLSSILYNKKILLPSDVVVEKGEESGIKKVEDVLPGEKILDAGPSTTNILKEKILEAQSVLWNGPLGEYERGFTTATREIALNTASSEAYTLVGGGDTLSAIADLHLEKQYSFVSTGGGAMLEFLLHGTLPGIKALEGSFK